MTQFTAPWHIIEDMQGFANIHHASEEDGDTGDIVATCFQDDEHARLIAAAPELLALVHQYRSDMLYPAAADSRVRRIVAIDAALAKIGGAA